MAAIPDKERFFVSEAVDLVRAATGLSESAARNRLYRRIASGEIPASTHLGVIMISRADVERATNGVRL